MTPSHKGRILRRDLLQWVLAGRVYPDAASAYEGSLRRRVYCSVCFFFRWRASFILRLYEVSISIAFTVFGYGGAAFNGFTDPPDSNRVDLGNLRRSAMRHFAPHWSRRIDALWCIPDGDYSPWLRSDSGA